MENNYRYLLEVGFYYGERLSISLEVGFYYGERLSISFGSRIFR